MRVSMCNYHSIPHTPTRLPSSYSNRTPLRHSSKQACPESQSPKQHYLHCHLTWCPSPHLPLQPSLLQPLSQQVHSPHDTLWFPTSKLSHDHPCHFDSLYSLLSTHTSPPTSTSSQSHSQPADSLGLSEARHSRLPPPMCLWTHLLSLLPL